MVPAGKREAVLGVLDDEGVDYAVTDETSSRRYAAVVSFPLPKAAVEPVLDRLREAGVEREAYTVVVAAETVVSDRFERLAAEYEEEGDGDRISREELVATAEALAPEFRTYLSMTTLSAVVATAGLLLDSPAVVVGSMVIAPLVGPAMATSVGTVVDDEELFRRGVRLQFLGGLVAVLAATAFAALLRVTGVLALPATEVFAIGEVRERLSPDVLSVAVALAAGGAGALSLSSGVSSALVGVMIAAALVPPTAVVGIGLALGRPTSVAGAAVLVLVNFLAVNASALGVLWRMGYRPTSLFGLNEARAATLRRAAVLVAGLLVLSAFLGAITYASVQSTEFEADARAAVADVAAANDLDVVSVEVGYEGFPVRRPNEVVVVLGHPPGETPPRVAPAVRDRVNGVTTGPFGLTDSRVAVEVRHVVLERAGGTTTPPASTRRATTPPASTPPPA
jgi:uncharacterized hydrophobic protein (TIGR00341 family)